VKYLIVTPHQCGPLPGKTSLGLRIVSLAIVLKEDSSFYTFSRSCIYHFVC
jgi:hypothetical protein